MIVHIQKQDGSPKCGSMRWHGMPLYYANETRPATCKRCLNAGFKPQAVTITENFVGKIFHTSWGYDMTFNEFAVVISQSETAITLQMCHTRTNGDEYGHLSQGKAWTDGKPTGKKFTLRKVTTKYGATHWTTYKHHYWSEWDGRPMYENHID